MPVTLEQVRDILGAEEPDYEQAARLGPEVLPHLRTLIDSETTPGEGAKAAYLAGLIDDVPGQDTVGSLLDTAARSGDPLIRLAVAATLPHVQSRVREKLARTLVTDGEIGVRTFTLEAVASSEPSPEPDSGLTALIRDLAEGEPSPALGDLARRIAERR